MRKAAAKSTGKTVSKPPRTEGGSSAGKPIAAKKSGVGSATGAASRPSRAAKPKAAGAGSAQRTGRKPAAPRGAEPKALPGKSMAATKAIMAAEKRAERQQPRGTSGRKTAANKGTGTGSSSSATAGPKRAGGYGTGPQKDWREHPARRQRQRRTEANEEITRLAGKQSRRTLELLGEATEAFAAGRERDALRILRPLAERYPDAMGVRELVGLCQYRSGNFNAAIRELEAFYTLSGSTEQHPVLMDCYRAQRLWKKVDEAWRELADTSPSAELVTEGRIVMAGSLSDRGRRDEAITLLEKRNAKAPRRVQPHHARLWYALGDLHERAGNLPRARALFQQVSKYDAQFADVAERMASLH